MENTSTGKCPASLKNVRAARAWERCNIVKKNIDFQKVEFQKITFFHWPKDNMLPQIGYIVMSNVCVCLPVTHILDVEPPGMSGGRRRPRWKLRIWRPQHTHTSCSTGFPREEFLLVYTINVDCYNNVPYDICTRYTKIILVLRRI